MADAYAASADTPLCVLYVTLGLMEAGRAQHDHERSRRSLLVFPGIDPVELKSVVCATYPSLAGQTISFRDPLGKLVSLHELARNPEPYHHVLLTIVTSQGSGSAYSSYSVEPSAPPLSAFDPSEQQTLRQQGRRSVGYQATEDADIQPRTSRQLQVTFHGEPRTVSVTGGMNPKQLIKTLLALWPSLRKAVAAGAEIVGFVQPDSSFLLLEQVCLAPSLLSSNAVTLCLQFPEENDSNQTKANHAADRLSRVSGHLHEVRTPSFFGFGIGRRSSSINTNNKYQPSAEAKERVPSWMVGEPTLESTVDRSEHAWYPSTRDGSTSPQTQTAAGTQTTSCQGRSSSTQTQRAATASVSTSTHTASHTQTEAASGEQTDGLISDEEGEAIAQLISRSDPRVQAAYRAFPGIGLLVSAFLRLAHKAVLDAEKAAVSSSAPHPSNRIKRKTDASPPQSPSAGAAPAPQGASFDDIKVDREHMARHLSKYDLLIRLREASLLSEMQTFEALKLLKKEDPLIIGSFLAFQVNGDLEDLIDSLQRLASRATPPQRKPRSTRAQTERPAFTSTDKTSGRKRPTIPAPVAASSKAKRPASGVNAAALSKAQSHWAEVRKKALEGLSALYLSKQLDRKEFTEMSSVLRSSSAPRDPDLLTAILNFVVTGDYNDAVIFAFAVARDRQRRRHRLDEHELYPEEIQSSPVKRQHTAARSPRPAIPLGQSALKSLRKRHGHDDEEDPRLASADDHDATEEEEEEEEQLPQHAANASRFSVNKEEEKLVARVLLALAREESVSMEEMVAMMGLLNRKDPTAMGALDTYNMTDDWEELVDTLKRITHSHLATSKSAAASPAPAKKVASAAAPKAAPAPEQVASDEEDDLEALLTQSAAATTDSDTAAIRQIATALVNTGVIPPSNARVLFDLVDKKDAAISAAFSLFKRGGSLEDFVDIVNLRLSGALAQQNNDSFSQALQQSAGANGQVSEAAMNEQEAKMVSDLAQLQAAERALQLNKAKAEQRLKELQEELRQSEAELQRLLAAQALEDQPDSPASPGSPPQHPVEPHDDPKEDHHEDPGHEESEAEEEEEEAEHQEEEEHEDEEDDGEEVAANGLPIPTTGKAKNQMNRELESIVMLFTEGILKDHEARMLCDLVALRDPVIVTAFEMFNSSGDWFELTDTLLRLAAREQGQASEQPNSADAQEEEDEEEEEEEEEESQKKTESIPATTWPNVNASSAEKKEEDPAQLREKNFESVRPLFNTVVNNMHKPDVEITDVTDKDEEASISRPSSTMSIPDGGGVGGGVGSEPVPADSADGAIKVVEASAADTALTGAEAAALQKLFAERDALLWSALESHELASAEQKRNGTALHNLQEQLKLIAQRAVDQQRIVSEARAAFNIDVSDESQIAHEAAALGGTPSPSKASPAPAAAASVPAAVDTGSSEKKEESKTDAENPQPNGNGSTKESLSEEEEDMVKVERASKTEEAQDNNSKA